MADVNIFIAFAAGVLSFLSPCVLPLIPSYLSFVSGVSLGEMQLAERERQIRRRLILNAISFIFGFSAVFISLGASASFLGSLFLGYRNFIRVIGGVFILLVGVYLMGLFKVSFLERYFQIEVRERPKGYAGSFFVGITFGVAWTPCVGPILGAILALAGTSGEVERGIILLAMYAGGLALPFFLSALAVNSFLHFSRVFRSYIHAVHVGAGVLLVVVGLLLITDTMTVLNAYAIRMTPQWLFERL